MKGFLDWDRSRNREVTADRLEKVLNDLEDVANEMKEQLAERSAKNQPGVEVTPPRRRRRAQ